MTTFYLTIWKVVHYLSSMESKLPPPAPPIDARSHLHTLAQATTAARLETYQRGEWWAPWVGAFIGPIFVAAEVLNGAAKFLTVGGSLFVMAAFAVREARKPRVRRRMGFLPGRLGWIHFGFIFVLIMSLRLGELAVDRMHDGLLAVVAYFVYGAFLSAWVMVFDRLIKNCAPERTAA